MKNIIKEILILPNDKLDYNLIIVLVDSVGKERKYRLGGLFENFSDKEQFLEKIKSWKSHFITWDIRPDKELENLDLKGFPGINANITNWQHLLTQDGKAVCIFSLVRYVLNEM